MTYYKPIATYHDTEDIIDLFPSGFLKGDEADIVVKHFKDGRGNPRIINEPDREAYWSTNDIYEDNCSVVSSDLKYFVRFQKGDASILFHHGNDQAGYYIDIYEVVNPEEKERYEYNGQTKLYDFYKSEYPEDSEIVEDLNKHATFQDAFECLQCGFDFYTFMGVPDSIVRERIFQGLAELMGCDYDYIYDQWLNHSKDIFGIDLVEDMYGLKFKNEED